MCVCTVSSEAVCWLGYRWPFFFFFVRVAGAGPVKRVKPEKNRRRCSTFFCRAQARCTLAVLVLVVSLLFRPERCAKTQEASELKFVHGYARQPAPELRQDSLRSTPSSILADRSCAASSGAPQPPLKLAFESSKRDAAYTSVTCFVRRCYIISFYYRSEPKDNDILYVNIESKRSLYFWTGYVRDACNGRNSTEFSEAL